MMQEEPEPMDVTFNHFFLLGCGWKFDENRRPVAPPQPKESEGTKAVVAPFELKKPPLPPPSISPGPPPRPSSPGPPERSVSPGPPDVAIVPPERPPAPPPPGSRETDAAADLLPLNVQPPICTLELKKPVLHFDTETAGLGAPGICQLSYILMRPGDPVVEYDKILKLPAGIKMSPDAVRIHRVTASMSAAGADPVPELEAFFNLVAEVKDNGGQIVCHNATFDVRAVNFTAQNLGLKQTLQATDVMCTMRASAAHSPLRTNNGRRKPFKLSELYAHLFGRPPAWARLHSAIDDSRVLALCFLEGAKLGWWEL